MHNATTQDRVRKPYRAPAVTSIGGLIHATSAGTGAQAETNCLVQISLSNNMMATDMMKAIRC
jgi:hypothetical protein